MTDNTLQIIYLSRLCSNEIYNKLYKLSGNNLLPQAQKYHKLMVEGLAAHPGVQIVALSSPPVNRNMIKKLFFKKSITIENNIIYHNIGLINLPILRNISMYLKIIIQIWRLSKKQKKNVVVCDVLCVTMANAALTITRLINIKTVGIVSDFPDFFSFGNLSSTKSIANSTISRFYAYLLLTVQMNEVINKTNKPFVVIEGQSDSKMAEKNNKLSKKHPERVCMYTGGLDKTYGIQLLTKAFILADIPGVQLLIYGKGDYEKELKCLALQHNNIRYGGILPNDQIVEEQIKATLLINPRPTDQEFTKYSFPSKNMEYIASGTPLLTTKLPGMPDEYLPYVYLFEEETVEGFAKTLREVLSLSAEELHKKGLAAKKFAMEHKNNVVQAGKLLKMIHEEVLST